MENRFKNVCRRLKALKGYSMAELTVVFIIMMGIILMVGKLAIGDRQKEYDAKFNKISALISANISKDLVENTGAEYADYASVMSESDNDGNKWLKEAVLNNVDVKGDASTPVASKTCTDCWGADEVVVPDGGAATGGASDAVSISEGTIKYKKFNKEDNNNYWSFYELNDNSVLAISDKNNTTTINKEGGGTETYYNTDILIDVNGKKGPNVYGKDIQVYNYPNKTCNHLRKQV